MCLFFKWWQILLAAGLLSVLASHLRVHPVLQTFFLVVVMVLVVWECVWCVHAYGVFTGTHLPWSEDDLGCWSSPLTLFDTGSLCLQLCMLGWLVCKLQGILQSLSLCRNAGIRDRYCYHTKLYVHAGDLNLGLHAHTVSALPSKLFLQPCVF